MKLLFDQNLSFRLCSELIAEFPNCKHVRDFGLTEAEDWEIWALAASQDYVVVSKDSDFYQRSLIQGAPPKIIWLKVGNNKTSVVASLLRDNVDVVREFVADATKSVLILN